MESRVYLVPRKIFYPKELHVKSCFHRTYAEDSLWPENSCGLSNRAMSRGAAANGEVAGPSFQRSGAAAERLGREPDIETSVPIRPMSRTIRSRRKENPTAQLTKVISSSRNGTHQVATHSGVRVGAGCRSLVTIWPVLADYFETTEVSPFYRPMSAPCS